MSRTKHCELEMIEHQMPNGRCIKIIVALCSASFDLHFYVPS